MIKNFDKAEENTEYVIAVDNPRVLRYCKGEFFGIDRNDDVAYARTPKFILETTPEAMDELIGTTMVTDLKRIRMEDPMLTWDNLVTLMGSKLAFCPKTDRWWRFHDNELVWVRMNGCAEIEMWDVDIKYFGGIIERINNGSLELKTEEEYLFWVKEQRAEYLRWKIGELSQELGKIEGK